MQETCNAFDECPFADVETVTLHDRSFQSVHSQDNSQYPFVSFLRVKSDRLMNLRRSVRTLSTPIGDRFTVNLLVRARSPWKYPIRIRDCRSRFQSITDILFDRLLRDGQLQYLIYRGC